MATENALPIGTRLDGACPGQYEIQSVLGKGGFGITYRAYDRQLYATVAIKEYLPEHLARRGTDGCQIVPRSESVAGFYAFGLKRFLEEARTLQLFRKESSIVRVVSFLEANGTGYLVMDYEEGRTLEEALGNNGVLTEAQIQALFVPLLKGLQVVHQAEYLHRDIKPSNIYLRAQGGPLLLDFGAARQALGERSPLVTVVLTEGYAPFEQYSSRGRLGPATDVYALGATLYRCITGQQPVNAPSRIEALQLQEPDPLPLTAKRCAGRFSAALLSLVDWMLAPLAKDRPQSITIVLEKLLASQSKATLAGEAQPPEARVRGRSKSGSDPFGAYADLEFETRHGFATQRFRYIKPGRFWMGSPASERSRYADEGARHQVTLTRGFWLADTACTQALWTAVMGSNPSGFLGEQLPVENVSWQNARQFLRILQEHLLDCHADLPTEAEWEYACRAGTQTPFSYGASVTSAQVNCAVAPSRHCTVAVRSLPSNPWGLYEMHGNVWEWCADGRRKYSEQPAIDPAGPLADEYRALRGGSWFGDVWGARSACRLAYPLGFRSNFIGFRICLKLANAEATGETLPRR